MQYFILQNHNELLQGVSLVSIFYKNDLVIKTNSSGQIQSNMIYNDCNNDTRQFSDIYPFPPMDDTLEEL